MGSSGVRLVRQSGPELSQDCQACVSSVDVSCPVKGVTWARQLCAAGAIPAGPDADGWLLTAGPASGVSGFSLKGGLQDMEAT